MRRKNSEKRQEDSASQTVDTAVETFLTEKKIGDRIRKLRLKKSMGLAELAEHTGLSASFLSQLETGRTLPTLRNLARIAMVFSKDLTYFIEPQPKPLFRIHRLSDRVRLPEYGALEPSFYFENLGYQVPERQLDPYYVEFLPGVKAEKLRTHRHDGFEFIFIISGALEIHYSSWSEVLEAGDAAYFDASCEHSYAAKGDKSAFALIVVTYGDTSFANIEKPTRTGKPFPRKTEK